MNRFVILFALICLILACKNRDFSSSETSKNISSKQLQKSVIENSFTFDYLSAKAKVNFSDGKMNQNFTANIRIENNKTIWMSLTGLFGIEGGRVLIEKDRVQIIDRLNGVYYDESFDFINSYIPFETDFEFLQTMLIGNSFQKTISKQRVEIVQDKYLVSDQFQGIDAVYQINNNFRYHQIDLSQAEPERSLQMSFGDYRFVQEHLFSMLRDLDFKEEDKIVNIDLHFTKIRKESELEFPFSVPDRMLKK